MNGNVSDRGHPRGLSSSEAAKRLARLGEPEPPTSRSTASIVAGNVFTLFNAIIAGFFILILSLGLFADAFFGFVAIVNSAIGIRQELKAKRTLDQLALLVAPRGKAIRDGEVIELRAEEIVPGDVVRIEPGDQLVADGVLVSSRGLALDESLLTGESDGIRKREGDRVLSGSFCLNGSGYYEVDAVREQSYAEKIAGEARAFRHPPSPLQLEVNRVLWATTLIMVPLAVLLLIGFQIRSVDFTEAVQTATAGLVTLIPEGLVLLMSVTLAVAAVRLARQNTLVQQMAATEALAAVDTICIDKTGTLTDGTLELVTVEVADQAAPARTHEELGSFAASAGERNRTLQTIAERYPAQPRRVTAEVPFSSEWKWSGVTLDGRGSKSSYVLGAPDVLAEAGALELPPALQSALDMHTSAGRRVVAFGEASGGLPSDPVTQPPPRLEPRALVVLEERLRPDAAETLEFMREQRVDLKLISGDARQTVTAVAHAVGVPRDAHVVEGSELPDDRAGLAEAADRNTIFCRIKPEQKKALVEALAERGRNTAMIGDGVNDVPALKRARLAVAMGSGSQISKGIADIVLLKDQFSMLPRAVHEGRRIARNIHRLARLYTTKTVYAGFLILTAALFGFTFPFLPRHLTVAAFLTIGIPSFVLALAPSEGPLYRGRLLRALAAFSVPAGLAIGAGSLLSFFLVDTVFAGTLGEARTAATTTLIVLGLAFILLLERGPGREHIAIQSYMLALVTVLGALYALAFAATPLREFFDLELLSSGQWFLSMLSVAIGLVLASVLWRLPQIQRLEGPETPERPPPVDAGGPAATHTPTTVEQAVRERPAADAGPTASA
jgi:cation-transporting P-type ATPase E